MGRKKMPPSVAAAKVVSVSKPLWKHHQQSATVGGSPMGKPIAAAFS